MKQSASYYAVYDNSGGITNGRPITLNGLKVGSIVDVSFNPGNLNSVVVSMEISDKSVLKIPIGSYAKLNSDLLAGPYIERNGTTLMYFTLLETHSFLMFQKILKIKSMND